LEELTGKDEELERLRQDLMDFQTEINVLKSGRRTESAEKSVKKAPLERIKMTLSTPLKMEY